MGANLERSRGLSGEDGIKFKNQLAEMSETSVRINFIKAERVDNDEKVAEIQELLIRAKMLGIKIMVENKCTRHKKLNEWPCLWP